MTPAPTPVPLPFSIPPIVAYVIAGVSTIIGLLVSQGLIDNSWERTITGIAAVALPLGYLAVNAIAHLAHAKVQAAVIAATPSVAGYGVPASGGKRH